MKKSITKTWLFYGSMVVLFCLFTYILFEKAKKFDRYSISEPVQAAQHVDGTSMFKTSIMHNITEPLAMLLLQIISILFVSRVFGWLFKKIGQPTVIGEILAGIVLGPSLLGYFYPNVYGFLFNPASLNNLYILSQVGLILFMFVIGMELNLGELRQKIQETYVISHASILIPYFLGMLLAYFVFNEFAAGKTNFISFALFIGISMSITAFPVLARIVQEKGLTRSHLGTISIASAAFNDITAWCVLAAVIAIARTGSFVSSVFNIGLAILYVLFMMLLVKPFLKKIATIYKSTEVVNKGIVAFLFLLLIISAYFTQLIGIHALFGAFLAGVVMPPMHDFRKIIIEKVEDVSVTFLLPLFFVYTGLHTEIGLLNTPHLWAICGLLILIAIFGKFAGGAFSAKILGENWRDSLSIGILMNTRGLMELIVLNIGYEMGILPPVIFVMLVIMAIFTTFMTTPLLSLVNFIFPEKNIEEEYIKQQAQGVFKALIALGNPENGKNLLHVAHDVLDGFKNTLAVTVLHITPGTDTNPIYGEDFSTESFRSIKEEAERREIPIETEYKVTDIIEQCVVQTTNQNNFDFLLVGCGVSMSVDPLLKSSSLFGKTWLNKGLNALWQHRSIFYPGALIKDKTRYFVEQSNCSVGIFVNRGFSHITSTIVILHDTADEFLLRYARRLIRNNPHASVTVLDVNRLLSTDESMQKAYENIKTQFPNHIKVLKSHKIGSVQLTRYSFMLISYPTWNIYSQSGFNALVRIPSTLIINKKMSRFHIGNRNRLIEKNPYEIEEKHL